MCCEPGAISALDRLDALAGAVKQMRRVRRPDMHMTIAFPDDNIGPCYLVPVEDFDGLRALVGEADNAQSLVPNVKEDATDE